MNSHAMSRDRLSLLTLGPLGMTALVEKAEQAKVAPLSDLEAANSNLEVTWRRDGSDLPSSYSRAEDRNSAKGESKVITNLSITYVYSTVRH